MEDESKETESSHELKPGFSWSISGLFWNSVLKYE